LVSQNGAASATGHGFKQEIEFDANRRSGKISFQPEAPGCVDDGLLRQLRGDDGNGREIDALPGKVLKDHAEAGRRVGRLKRRRALVAQDREVPGLHGIVQCQKCGAD
jgi:hypothetical protein